MRLLRLLPLLVAACGGSAGLGSHESCADAHIEAMEDLMKVLDGIHDLASAEAARPRTEAIGRRVRDINAAENELPPAGPVQQAQLDRKLEATARDLERRAQEAMARLKGDAKAVVLLSEMLIEAVALDTDR